MLFSGGVVEVDFLVYFIICSPSGGLGAAMSPQVRAQSVVVSAACFIL
jgi:hypothetical protein